MVWGDGYAVTGLHRPLYHPATGPVFAGHALRHAGIEPGPLQVCCELGFGMGVAVAIHAAAGGAWWGTDVMPAQVAAARRLAPQAVLHDEGFAEFCARDDLPAFDFVVVHGVWSWISAPLRQVVLDFLARRLRPGGVLLVSYNMAVGWGQVVPLRQALCHHAQTSSPPGLGAAEGARRALPVLQELFDAGSTYARNNPLAGEILARMHQTPGQMLVHEFMGAHWTPFDFATLAAEMAGAKLEFGVQAARLPVAARLYYTPAQRAILDAIPDPVFRELVSDVLTGERFRRDYWVKGAHRRPPAEAARVEDALAYVLTVPAAEVALQPDLPQGQVTLPPAITAPVLAVLADHAPHEFGAIVAESGLPRADALDALMLLCDGGAVQPAAAEGTVDRAGCAAFNARVIADAASGGTVAHLAHPLTGGGVAVSTQELLWLAAERAGVDPGPAAARFAARRAVLRAHAVA